MAETINNYFGSVFTREDNNAIPVPASLQIRSPMPQAVITVRMVREKIRGLRKGSAPGPDGITVQFLQTMEDQVAYPLTLLFRKSLSTGHVPNDWKCANVTPIYKKGTKRDPGNYRPVSLTSIACKMMESILKEVILSHLEGNRLISNSQHGFMPRKSCSTNLLEFLEVVTKTVDSGQPMDLVYLDFSKAFDKVPKERLLAKVRAHGISREVETWIRAWLTERKQRVMVNGVPSSWIEVLSGVPQGSVLGPLLFVIFINDLDKEAEGISIIRKFADDTKVGQVLDEPQAHTALQNCLDRLCVWTDTWGMSFNVKKCKVIHVGPGNPCHGYTMNGNLLDASSEEKDVGVLITDTLKQSRQCEKAAQTANRVLSQICRSFQYRNRHTFVRLYKQHVRPHLEFATPAWNPWLATDKETLERVQKRAVRMVSGLQNRTYEARLKELGLTTLEARRERADMIQTFKIMNNLEDVDATTWFTRLETGRTTRLTMDGKNLARMGCRTEMRRHFFSSRVVERWNALPTELKSAKGTQSFKRQYDSRAQETPLN